MTTVLTEQAQAAAFERYTRAERKFARQEQLLRVVGFRYAADDRERDRALVERAARAEIEDPEPRE